MYSVRLWSTRNARFLERVYDVFEPVFIGLNPLWSWLGFERVEKPMAFVESKVKGFLFDCQMCGDCVLSSTGMSCPMNCPKQLRNGPCGGVRANGHCEVIPEMRCVWVEAYKGSHLMKKGGDIENVLVPIDRSQWGRSSWLKIANKAHKEKTDKGPEHAV